MTIYTEGFIVTSSSTGEELFSRTSTEEEPYRILSIYVTDVSEYGVYLNVTVERESIMKDVPLSVIADSQPPREFVINIDLPVGQKIVAEIKDQSAGYSGIVTGWYTYEIRA